MQIFKGNLNPIYAIDFEKRWLMENSSESVMTLRIWEQIPKEMYKSKD